MSSFSVDPEELGTMAENLATLGSMIESLKSISAQDTSGLGGATIESAVEGFAKTWSYGIAQLDKHVDNVAQNAGTAAENYFKSDESVARAAAKID